MMCISIPAVITGLLQKGTAEVSVHGQLKEVAIAVDDPAVGDCVLIHAGIAIRKIDQCEAQEIERYLLAAKNHP